MASDELTPVQLLLMRSLAELDPYAPRLDGQWTRQVAELSEALLSLDQPEADTLREVVEAVTAVQQFLLGLAIRPDDGPSRAAILDVASWLMRGADVPLRHQQ